MKTKSIYTIFTFGHSNRPLDIFLSKLTENNIEVLVDVRTYPVSRWTPHFSQNILAMALETINIHYLYRGQNLGGRGENTGYEDAIDELSAIAKEGRNICVMCSEGDFRKCHRYTDLTPSFEKRGLSVVHLQYENKNELKRITNSRE
ncbi:MAG: DUF488 domain-containing protein [Candidatus Parcubacteria bacterium]|nr:DUF488 domain-containing protein [Candidatus Parcubacteria bacterium]